MDPPFRNYMVSIGVLLPPLFWSEAVVRPPHRTLTSFTRKLMCILTQPKTGQLKRDHLPMTRRRFGIYNDNLESIYIICWFIVV